MNAPLEKTIQRAIAKRLDELGAWYYKKRADPYGRRNILDFIVIYKGLGFALEVKRPGPKHDFAPASICPHCWVECTPGQREEIKSVIRSGGVATVVTSPNEAEVVLARAAPGCLDTIDT